MKTEKSRRGRSQHAAAGQELHNPRACGGAELEPWQYPPRKALVRVIVLRAGQAAVVRACALSARGCAFTGRGRQTPASVVAIFPRGREIGVSACQPARPVRDLASQIAICLGQIANATSRFANARAPARRFPRRYAGAQGILLWYETRHSGGVGSVDA